MFVGLGIFRVLRPDGLPNGHAPTRTDHFVLRGGLHDSGSEDQL